MCIFHNLISQEYHIWLKNIDISQDKETNMIDHVLHLCMIIRA